MEIIVVRLKIPSYKSQQFGGRIVINWEFKFDRNSSQNNKTVVLHIWTIRLNEVNFRLVVG